MKDDVKIWVKFTGKHDETHRYVCKDAREALAIQAGAEFDVPLDELHDFAEACVDVYEEYDGPVPYVYVADVMATEWKAQSAGGSPVFDLHDPKAATLYVKNSLI